MLVPIAQARNPLTGGNWQGSGVAPDIAVPADQALIAAQRDAARLLIERHPDDPITRELKALLEAEAIEARPNGALASSQIAAGALMVLEHAILADLDLDGGVGDSQNGGRRCARSR